jgi:mono/diheme cytochrome c family protein
MQFQLPTIPRWVPFVGLFLGVVTLIPFAFIIRARTTTSEKPRVHIIRDMDTQERFDAQQENSLFADGRSMRAPVPGTVARGELRTNTHLEQGRVSEGGDWVTTFPASLTVDEALIARGQERFEIFCAMCHGSSGYGDGMVERRVTALKKKQDKRGTGDWASPSSYHTPAVRGLPLGQLFNTVSNGKANMAGYKRQISVRDRWAIVAYVKVLQLSQSPE